MKVTEQDLYENFKWVATADCTFEELDALDAQLVALNQLEHYVSLVIMIRTNPEDRLLDKLAGNTHYLISEKVIKKSVELGRRRFEPLTRESHEMYKQYIENMVNDV